MKKVIIILFSLILTLITCKEEGEDCHLKFTVVNKSMIDIMYGWNIKNTSNECNISVTVIKPNEAIEIRMNDCWESILANGLTEEFYIIDPSHYNTPGVFYDCDSLQIKNTILKHYILTLDNLRTNNFEITYP
jgi:hypothetical protein